MFSFSDSAVLTASTEFTENLSKDCAWAGYPGHSGKWPVLKHDRVLMARINILSTCERKK